MNSSTRYDFARVERALDAQLETVAVAGSCGQQQLVEPGDDRKAEVLGVSRQTLRRWRRDGVPEQQTGKVAQAVGRVDFEVWPELLPEVEKVCEADDCTTRFLPPLRVPYKRFCSSNCKRRQQRRDQYRNDPAFRERTKQAMRRYYEETREWQVKRSRWYREQAKRRAA